MYIFGMKAMSAFRIGMDFSVFLGQYSDRYIGQVLSLGWGKSYLLTNLLIAFLGYPNCMN
jgi:hypothetical protein